MTEARDALKAAHEALEGVTPGEWKVTTCMDYWVEPVDPSPKHKFNGIALCGDIGWPGADKMQKTWERNARFIAYARSGVPALSAHLEAVLAENERLREALDEFTQLFWGLAPKVSGIRESAGLYEEARALLGDHND